MTNKIFNSSSIKKIDLFAPQMESSPKDIFQAAEEEEEEEDFFAFGIDEKDNYELLIQNENDDYITPTNFPEDAIKSCDKIIEFEIPSLESLASDHEFSLPPFEFDRYTFTLTFSIDCAEKGEVYCYIKSEEKISVDISLYINSLNKASFNRNCYLGNTPMPARLTPAIFQPPEIPTEPVKAYLSIHKTPPDTLCRQYFNCVGLVNSGMTCYLNSLIQCLFHLKKFRTIVFGSNSIETAKIKKSKILNAMRDLFTRMQISYIPVSTRELTTSFEWAEDDLFQQHDVQELIRILLDRLDDATDKLASSLFKGKKEVAVVTESARIAHVEEFQDLDLPVKNFTNINDSIKSYFEPNQLTGSDQYQLEDGTKCDAEIQTKIIENPMVLCLHLCRFEYTDGQFSKIYSPFAYGEELLFNDQEYELISIISHNGSIYGGHYNAYAKIDGQWTNFDDETVRHCEAYEVFNENFGDDERPHFTAYILFYAMKGLNDMPDPEPPQDVIDNEKKRCSEITVAIAYGDIQNYKEITVDKNIDSLAYLQVLSEETGIPVDDIVVREINQETNETQIIDNPVPSSSSFIYVDNSKLLPVWVTFWIPGYEFITFGAVHVLPSQDTLGMVIHKIMEMLDFHPENEPHFDCFFILGDDYQPMNLDDKIEQSCCLLYEFSSDSQTKENVDAFIEAIEKKKDVLNDFTILEKAELPELESHIELLQDEITMNNAHDFIQYMKSNSQITFIPFDDIQDKSKQINMELSNYLTFDQVKKCLARKFDDVDINQILLFLPSYHRNTPHHVPINRNVFPTLDTMKRNSNYFFFEIHDTDIQYATRVDVTVIDSVGQTLDRFPILMPRGPSPTLDELRKLIMEKIDNKAVYLFYVKDTMPIFIPTLNDIKEEEDQAVKKNQEKLATEVQFEYRVFAQILNDGQADVDLEDQDKYVKIRVVHCEEQLLLAIIGQIDPFILFIEKGKTLNDVKEMFPKENVMIIKQVRRQYEFVDENDDRPLTQSDIVAFTYKQPSDSYYSGGAMRMAKEVNKDSDLEDEEEDDEFDDEEEEEGFE